MVRLRATFSKTRSFTWGRISNERAAACALPGGAHAQLACRCFAWMLSACDSGTDHCRRCLRKRLWRWERSSPANWTTCPRRCCDSSLHAAYVECGPRSLQVRHATAPAARAGTVAESATGHGVVLGSSGSTRHGRDSRRGRRRMRDFVLADDDLAWGASSARRARRAGPGLKKRRDRRRPLLAANGTVFQDGANRDAVKFEIDDRDHLGATRDAGDAREKENGGLERAEKQARAWIDGRRRLVVSARWRGERPPAQRDEMSPARWRADL